MLNKLRAQRNFKASLRIYRCNIFIFAKLRVYKYVYKILNAISK